LTNRRSFIAGSAATIAAGSILAADSCAPNVTLLQPATGAQSAMGAQPAYELIVHYGTHEMLGYTLHTRTYDGKLRGPTIETRPGETLRIRVTNKLPPNPDERPPAEALVPFYADPSMGAMAGGVAKTGSFAMRRSTHISQMNNPHAFNTTNLHVHGIQTVPHLFFPVGTSDPTALMIAIEPGDSFLYSFPIPADHPSGLYWYHPHHHGATDVQIAGGMAGLLVVRGPIDDVPEIKAAREIFLSVQSLLLNPSRSDPKRLQYEFVAYKPPFPKGKGFNCPPDYMIVTVNEQPVSFVNYTKPVKGFTSVEFTQHEPPVYRMQPGEVVRLRILNGTNFVYMPLALPGMEVYVIERDGINLPAPELLDQDEAPRVVDAATIYAGTTVDMSPAARAELLIRAKKPGRYALKSVASRALLGMNFPDIDLAHFVVEGSPVSMSVPKSLPLPKREYPLIRENEIVRKRTLRFSEKPSTEILTGTAFLLNGKLYDETRIDLEPVVGTAEAWTLTNTSSEVHAFHIHTNSFEVHAVNGSPIPVTLRDTILLPPMRGGTPGSIDFRIRYKQHRGKDVLHCHILGHEDEGMMENTLLS